VANAAAGALVAAAEPAGMFVPEAVGERRTCLDEFGPMLRVAEWGDVAPGS